MKTVLIIIGILFALGLFGMLIPAIIAAGVAWLLFTSGHIIWGLIVCGFGLFAEVLYIQGVFLDGGGEHHHYDFDSDDDGGRTGISWPQAFTALYIIDHFRNKDD